MRGGVQCTMADHRCRPLPPAAAAAAACCWLLVTAASAASSAAASTAASSVTAAGPVQLYTGGLAGFLKCQGFNRPIGCLCSRHVQCFGQLQCDNYVCGGDQCAGDNRAEDCACSSDSQCASGFCSGGACGGLPPNGQRTQADGPDSGGDVPGSPFSCASRPQGYHADPSGDCQTFFRCVAREDGVMMGYEFTCPSGTVFSSSTPSCDWRTARSDDCRDEP